MDKEKAGFVAVLEIRYFLRFVFMLDTVLVS